MFRLICLAGVLLAAPLVAQPVSQSDKPLNNAEGTFRFAIMGDRTGGMLPGVFEKGAEKVNLMQPEFVLSVGDLVDGYTTDPDVWNAQWNEFDAIVNRLKMRFYYVPGNHDISNPQLDAVWRERHGSPWYTFRYKDVLFVALHTEDRLGGGIGTQQLADITAALETNRDARWTLLFMHRPLWNYGNKAGYEQIESALGDRNYTLFSGHHHHYLYSQHNGRDHYVLATTGGGSHLRGVEFGEFEHITWVTMTDEGPQVAHLELDGILGKEIVTDENNRMIQALRMGQWMSIDPIRSSSPLLSRTNTVLRFRNSEPESMRVTGSLQSQLGIRFMPSEVDLIIPGLSDTILHVDVVTDTPVSIQNVNDAQASITLSAMYKDRGRELSLPTTVALRMDWTHHIGDEMRITRPVYMQEDWDWKGPDDGRFSVKTSIDATYLHVDITAWDDRIILPSRTQLSAHQDQFYVHLDAIHEMPLKIRIAPGTLSDRPLIEIDDLDVHVRARSEVFPDEGQFQTRVSIPLSYIEKTQGQDWTSIRLNVGWMDHDRPENTKPSILWLRPVWGKAEDWSGSGVWSR